MNSDELLYYFLLLYMIIPKHLEKGSRVMLVAPARKIVVQELEPAIKRLREWELEVITSKHLYGDFNQYSGKDDERANDMQTALNDPAIRAIICVRGGYGTLRLMDALDYSGFRKSPKWLVGYSDITTMHAHLNCLGFSSIHATMPINFEKDAGATDTLRKVLFGEGASYSCGTSALNRKGTVSGELVGGNLSLLYALQGSKSDLKTAGKILFLEDLDEYLYHIDRMMLSLKRSGKLEHLAGLVIGGMTEMKDNTLPFGMTAEEIIRDAVKEYSFPVCFGFPAGHIDKNYALKLGVGAKLEVTDAGATLSFK